MWGISHNTFRGTHNLSSQFDAIALMSAVKPKQRFVRIAFSVKADEVIFFLARVWVCEWTRWAGTEAGGIATSSVHSAKYRTIKKFEDVQQLV